MEDHQIKNIIYIGGFELPDRNAAAHRVISNAKILRSLGYSVSFISITKNFHDEKPVDLQLKSGSFKVWNVGYPRTIIEWLKYLTGISSILKIVNSNYSNKPFAIIAYDYPAIVLFRLLLFCKKNNIKLIGDSTEWYIASGSLLFRIIKMLDTFLRMRIINKKLDGLIVISTYLFNYYKPFVNNLLTLPPLVDKEDDIFTVNLASTNNIKTIVYAGSPVYGKKGVKDRIDKVLIALSEIKKRYRIDFRFIIIGISQEEFIRIFGIESIPDNIIKSVTFTGKIPHKEVLQITNHADYSIFIRDNNRVTMAGFPTKFSESIRCGTPVLTNPSSNITDYLKNGELGFLIDLTSKQTLINSILKAISQSPDKIKIMKQKCLESDTFDFRRYIKSFETFLNKMI